MADERLDAAETLRQRHELKAVEHAPGGGPLAGKRLVVTGTLPTLSREAARALIEAAGGQVSESVSAKTDYLVVGESAGSKLAKAQALGVTLLDEAGLRALVAG